jgi:rubredoxin
MKINFLLGVPVMGELSPNTVKTNVFLCESCKRRKTHYSNITYIFDRWRGEDIISGFAEFFISQRLKEKLEEKKIKGYKLTSVKTTFSKQRGGISKFEKGAYQKELPNFYYFEVLGKAEGDINDWYEIIDTSECPKCKANKKLITIEGMGSMETPELTGKQFENPLTRNVYEESWQGDDVFLLQDGLNLPIVTQNFIDCLSELDIKLNEKEGVWFRPTNWIDDRGNIIE